MLKSMTGFGRGEYEDEKFSATVEMKTVNHRYNEVAIRLPRFLNPLEDRIRKTILRSINRGRIDVFITADYVNDGLCTVKVDKPLAAAYHNALQEVAEAAGIGGCKLAEQAEVLYLARCPDVISVKEGFLTLKPSGRSLNRLCSRLLTTLLPCAKRKAAISTAILSSAPR